MQDLYEDFIEGDEVRMIKELISKANTVITTASVLGYLVLLDLLPRFTIVMTFLAVGSLFVTHFVKKWSKSQ